MMNVLPVAPRKLIRTAELLRLNLSIAAAGGWHDCDPAVMARLVILQQFAPALYRFISQTNNRAALGIMQDWARTTG